MNKKIVFVLMALGGQLTAMAAPLGSLDTEALTDSSKVVDLDEVVVVSQPKEQVRLRLQPVSSNVFGSEQLKQLNVRDLSQLSQYVPSFVMPSYGSRLTSSMYVIVCYAKLWFTSHIIDVCPRNRFAYQQPCCWCLLR